VKGVNRRDFGPATAAIAHSRKAAGHEIPEGSDLKGMASIRKIAHYTLDLNVKNRGQQQSYRKPYAFGSVSCKIYHTSLFTYQQG
jgi:hypothetical protein